MNQKKPAPQFQEMRKMKSGEKGFHWENTFLWRKRDLKSENDLENRPTTGICRGQPEILTGNGENNITIYIYDINERKNCDLNGRNESGGALGNG